MCPPPLPLITALTRWPANFRHAIFDLVGADDRVFELGDAGHDCIKLCAKQSMRPARLSPCKTETRQRKTTFPGNKGGRIFALPSTTVATTTAATASAEAVTMATTTTSATPTTASATREPARSAARHGPKKQPWRAKQHHAHQYGRCRRKVNPVSLSLSPLRFMTLPLSPLSLSRWAAAHSLPTRLVPQIARQPKPR